MRILVVNHGYPPVFNAGSEIYTENLVHGLLIQGHKVEVFSRDENPFLPDFSLSTTSRYTETGISYLVHLINVPRQKDRYQSKGVDVQFGSLLNSFKPDLIHFNHLNHLSLGLIDITFAQKIKIIFTLHDYWLACPRGQFLQINYGEDEPHSLCSSQEDMKCATHCYSRYHTGLIESIDLDLNYWSQWVSERQKLIQKIINQVDIFIAPSRSLLMRMKNELAISSSKIIFLDYGFELERLKNRNRVIDNEIVFGYIGTHIIAKGINHLLKAFSKLRGDAKLIIFGRNNGETTPYLKDLYRSHNVEWRDEYFNENIVKEVLNQVDVIVVPSIWYENSPLVIHEAQQVRIPVITANAGGMADYVHHMKNGLLFDHRDPESLKQQLQIFIDDHDLVGKLGQRGYLFSESGDVISIKDHVIEIVSVYREVIS